LTPDLTPNALDCDPANADDLVAAADAEESGPVRIVRASVERWQAAGGANRAPSSRNAWALIGLSSGDQPLSERWLGLLERNGRRAERPGWKVLRGPTRAPAAAHILGGLWASASQGLSV
jgi:hypothetical protein